MNKNIIDSISHISKQSFWIILLQLVTAGSAFFITVFLTRIFSEHSFGTYRYFMAFVPLLLVFTLPNLGTSLTVFIAQKKYVSINQLLQKKIVYSLFAGFISLLFAGYYFVNGNTDLFIGFLVLAFGIPLFDAFGLYKFYLHGIQDFKTSALTQMVTKILVTLSIVGVAFLSKNPVWVLAAFVLGPIIPQMIWYFYTLNTYTPTITDTKVWKYGAELSFLGAFQTIVFQIDKLLVWQFFGAEGLAFYVVALTIPLEVARIFESITTVSLPLFSQQNWRSKMERKKFNKLLFIMTCVLFAGPFVYWLIAPFIFSLLFPAYSSFAMLSVLASFFIPLVVYNNIIMTSLLAEKKSRALFIVAGVSGTIIVIGGIYAGVIGSLYYMVGVLLCKEIIQVLLQSYYFIYSQDTEPVKTD